MWTSLIVPSVREVDGGGGCGRGMGYFQHNLGRWGFAA